MGIQALILDMDGVLWRGQELIGPLPSIFRTIREAGFSFVLATNNATRSIGQYRSRFAALGIQLAENQVLNSALAAARYLLNTVPKGSSIYVIGEEGLQKTLADHGFEPGTRGVAAVVVSLDRELTYEKLKTAALLIRGGVPFVATNPDRTLPTPQGQVPGSGSIVAALQAATDVTPVVVGKPSADLFLLALERLGTTPETTLVVGDRLETDIAGGQAAGCKTAVVLSGVATRADAEAWQPQPDFCEPDLESLLETILRNDR